MLAKIDHKNRKTTYTTVLETLAEKEFRELIKKLDTRVWNETCDDTVILLPSRDRQRADGRGSVTVNI